jgi:hypothetical protein
LPAFGLGVCLGVLPLVVTNIPWVQSHVLVGDDRALGLALFEETPDTGGSQGLQVTDGDRARIARCQQYALALYDHPIPADSVRPFPGWATPAEKAFYAACVGGPDAHPGGD